MQFLLCGEKKNRKITIKESFVLRHSITTLYRVCSLGAVTKIATADVAPEQHAYAETERWSKNERSSEEYELSA